MILNRFNAGENCFLGQEEKNSELRNAKKFKCGAGGGIRGHDMPIGNVYATVEIAGPAAHRITEFAKGRSGFSDSLRLGSAKANHNAKEAQP